MTSKDTRGHDQHEVNVHRTRARQPGRGREAMWPWGIPPRGYLDVGRRVAGQIASDRVSIAAAAIAFYAILGLFPGLAALTSLYGLFADPATVTDHMLALSGVIPQSILELIRDELATIAANRADTLSMAFFLTVILWLWIANNAMKCLFQTMNMAYDERERRGFLRLTGITFLCTLGVMAVIILSLGLIVAVPALFNFAYMSRLARLAAALLPPLLMFVVFVLGLAVVYRLGPNRRPARWRWLSPGAVLAGILWVAASALFAVYLGNFANYSATYGSLGALFGLLTWLYISAYVVLLGAEVNAEIEHQTARDSTIGAPRPLGERGAEMADTVGPARPELRRKR